MRVLSCPQLGAQRIPRWNYHYDYYYCYYYYQFGTAHTITITCMGHAWFGLAQVEGLFGGWRRVAAGGHGRWVESFSAEAIAARQSSSLGSRTGAGSFNTTGLAVIARRPPSPSGEKNYSAACKRKAPRGGRTRNLEIKSLTLYRLS